MNLFNATQSPKIIPHRHIAIWNHLEPLRTHLWIHQASLICCPNLICVSATCKESFSGFCSEWSLSTDAVWVSGQLSWKTSHSKDPVMKQSVSECHSFSTRWSQVGTRLEAIRTHALYTAATHFPVRTKEVGCLIATVMYKTMGELFPKVTKVVKDFANCC